MILHRKIIQEPRWQSFENHLLTHDPIVVDVKSEAILANLKAGRGQNGTTIKIVVTSAESSGNLGYGIGTYAVTGPDGTPLDHGKWMLVSKKSDGKWKTQCDIFNSDIPR